MTAYRLYCGRFDCPSRRGDKPELFTVEEDELVDGEVWVCPSCRQGQGGP